MTEETQMENVKLDLAVHLDKCSPGNCVFGCPEVKRLREEAARDGTLETPESIEARAAMCMERGECTAGAHLRGYASGIREGEWRATLRVAAALRNLTPEEAGRLYEAYEMQAGGRLAAVFASAIEAGRL